MGHRRGVAIVTALAATLGLTACSADGGAGARPAPTTPPSASAPGGVVPVPTASGGGSCPASYAAPDPDRPRITLTFDLSDDLATVRGTEQVRFVPDLPVREVVFRLTPNGPTATRHGSSLRVTRAEAGGNEHATFEHAGADPTTQGGLLVVPLGRTAPAGEEVTARVEFTLTLGSGGLERLGRGGGTAWWGTGQPLFAWERGVGWHREPLLKILGESATSEAARIDLTVTAPAAVTVLSSGVQDRPRDAGDGRRRWHATAEAARDVSVAAGALHTAERTVEGTHVTVGALSAARLDEVEGRVAAAVTGLRGRLGPFPYPSLTVTLLPFRGGGIEYPSSILLLDDDRTTVTHEVAHEWFYGMVGDSQARDPWLDEAFATYAEELVNGEPAAARTLSRAGRVGDPMTAFTNSDYFGVVYAKGAAALRAARTAAGPDRFDAALRCYVNANAWRIARPSDLERALADLPRALEVLRRAGAL